MQAAVHLIDRRQSSYDMNTSPIGQLIGPNTLAQHSRSYAQHLFPPGLDQQPLLRISGIIPCLSAAAATPMQSIGDDCKGQLYGLR
jgi:hypothetical protein